MHNPTNNPDGRQYGLPFAEPLDTEPTVTPIEAVEMVRIAARHVGPLGGQDREILAWLPNTDTRATVVVASLIRRAWAAGLGAGRAELLDEASAVAAARRTLADLADVVDGLVDRADVAVGDGGDPGDLIEQLTADLRAAVEGYTRGGDRLAKVAEQYAGRYRAIVAGDSSTAQRQLAFTVAVESAATMTNSDAELAEAVRAIVAADQEADEAAAAALAEILAEFDAPLSRSYCEACDEAQADGRDGLCSTCRDKSTADQGAADDAMPAPRGCWDDPGVRAAVRQVLDAEEGDGTKWCRICDERPAPPASTVCVYCEHDLAEGRINDPEGEVPAPTPASRDFLNLTCKQCGGQFVSYHPTARCEGCGQFPDDDAPGGAR